MYSVGTWGEAISGALTDLWLRFINFIPSLVGALLVFFLGLIVAVALGKVAEKVIMVLRIDQLIDRMKLGEKIKGAGFKLSVAHFVGELVKWFLILVFLMAATDILGLDQVTIFLDKIISYIPQIVVATIILSLAFLLGNFVFNVVRGSTRAAGIMSAALLATISKWAIVIVGLLAALQQLGIAVALINTIFTGVVAALAIALGLAFGLGGKDEASSILAKLREDLTHNHKE
jgi:hypothetical protein